MPNSKPSLFTRFAKFTSSATGRPSAFIAAAFIVFIWAVTGPIFKYSDTWQLVINTGTTIVTFLMVFLIQNSQNRDSLAIQLKLDELIKAVNEARNEMIDVEDLDEQELVEKREEMAKLAEEAHETIETLDDKLHEKKL